MAMCATRIVVGVAGCGFWGSHHLRALGSLPGVSTIAIDTVPERAATAASLFGSDEALPSVEACLDRVDGLVVATPADSHSRIGMTAVSSCVPVLVEKPFTLRLAEAQAMAEAAQARCAPVFVGHTFMYSAVVQAIAREVATGRLGRIGAVRFVRSNVGTTRTDSNVLWDLAPHDLSILSLMFGWPASVRARATRWVNGQVVAAVLMLSYGELEVEVELSWCAGAKRRYLSLIGEDATLTHDLQASGPLHVCTSGGRTYCVRVEQGIEPLILQAISFAAAIRGESEHRYRGTEASDGVATVAVLEAAERSMERQEPCRVQYDIAGCSGARSVGAGREGPA